VADTGGDILTDVELDSAVQSAGTRHVAPLSQGLAQLAISQAAALAIKVPTAIALRARPVRQSAAALGGLRVLVALVAVVLPRLSWTQWNRFWDPFADKVPQHEVRDFYWTIRVMTGPEVLRLRKEIRDQAGMEKLR